MPLKMDIMGKMRLELMTSGTTNQRSNQLSYIPEQVGIIMILCQMSRDIFTELH